jgi:hypothetical protein
LKRTALKLLEDIRSYSACPASLGTLLGVFEDPIPFHGIMNGTDRMRDRRP